MRLLLVSLLFSICSISPVACLAQGFGQGPNDRYALYADFNNKVHGDPIGTRGATFGEPTSVSSLETSIISITPGQNVLRVGNDVATSSARTLVWPLMGDAEMTTGEVRVSFELTLGALDRYTVHVNESSTQTKHFLVLGFDEAGGIKVTGGSSTPSYVANGYTANQVVYIDLLFDMTARTRSTRINGNWVEQDKPFGIADRGIGTIRIGYQANSGGAPFDLDNLRATGALPFPLALEADFDDKTPGTQINVRGAEFNEPMRRDPGLDTTIIADGATNNFLEIAKTPGASTRALYWQFLSYLEIDSGLIIMDFDMALTVRDEYTVSVREPGGVSRTFIELLFHPNGAISFRDRAASAYELLGVDYNGGQIYRYRIVFNMDTGTYNLFRDGVPLLRERAHGVTTRGIGRLFTSISYLATTNAHIQFDSFRVYSTDLLALPSKLQFLQEATTGVVGQAVTPATKVVVMNVMGDLVANSVPVEIQIASGSGPAGAILSGTDTTSVFGVATFSALKFDTPGTYRLAAKSLRRTALGHVDLVVSPSDIIFADGFDSNDN